MASATQAFLIGCSVGLAAYAVSLNCQGAEPLAPWPQESKREAINGCTQSNIDGAVSDYKKRANVSELPPETMRQIAEVAQVPALALCSCVVSEMERSTSIGAFSSGSDATRAKFLAAMNGPCVGYTPSKWKVYVPADSARQANERVSLEKINFVESDEILAANTSIQDVLSYVERVRKTTVDAFIPYPGGVTLTVGFNCEANKCSVLVARNQADALQRSINDLRERLVALTAPTVSGPVAFYAYFRILPQ